jgi:hypothetical protein
MATRYLPGGGWYGDLVVFIEWEFGYSYRGSHLPRATDEREEAFAAGGYRQYWSG